MSPELSMKRVVRAIEKRIAEAPSPELLTAYTALLERLGEMKEATLNETGQAASRVSALEERMAEMDKRLAFVETCSKVRKIG